MTVQFPAFSTPLKAIGSIGEKVFGAAFREGSEGFQGLLGKPPIRFAPW